MAEAGRWTVGPDAAADEDAAGGSARRRRASRRRPPARPGRGRWRRVRGASRLTLATAVIAVFVVVVLVVTKDGPFRALDGAGTASAQAPSAFPDVKGTWAFLVSYDNALFEETAHISQENLRTGAYSGTVASPVGTQVISGTASVSSVSFSIRLGTTVETGTAVLSSSGGRLHLAATFANSRGGRGAITATRTST